MSTNIKSSKLNDVIENELKFDSVNSLANNDVNNTLPIPYLFYTGGTVLRAFFTALVKVIFGLISTYRVHH